MAETTILDFIIPTIIFIVIGFLMYSKLKKPIDALIKLIKDLFDKGKGKIKPGEWETIYVPREKIYKR